MTNLVEVLVRAKNDTEPGLKSAQSSFKDGGSKIAAALKPVGIAMAGSGILSMGASLGAAGLALGAFGAVAAPTLDKVQKALTSTGAAGKKAWAALDPTERGIARNLQQLKGTFDGLAKSFEPVVAGVVKMAAQLGGDLMPTLRVLGTAGGNAIQMILTPIDKLVSSNKFAGYMKSLAADAQLAAPLIGKLLAGSLDTLLQLMVKLAPIGTQLLASFTPLFLGVIQSAVPIVSALGSALNGIFKFLDPFASVVGPIAIGLYAMVKAIQLVTGVMKVWEVVTKLMTTAEGEFDITLAANPIGLVVIAIAALIAATIILIKNWNTVKAVTADVWHAMEVAAGTAVGGILKYVKFMVNAFIDAAHTIVHVLAMIPGPQQSMLRSLDSNIGRWQNSFNSSMNSAIRSVQNWGHATGSSVAGAIANMNNGGAAARRLQANINALHGKNITITTYANLIKTTYVRQIDGGRIIGNGYAYAHGGIVGAAGGGPRSKMTMVGEQGREMVELPSGSRVHSNPDTERMMSQGGGGSSKVTLEIKSSGAPVDEFIATILRKYVRVNGGDVQVVLGH